MRRSDRAVTELSDILALLEKCQVLRLGLCTDNQPYIVPMHFAYERVGEDVFVYLHSAPAGRKIDMIAANSRVCFEADTLHQTLEAEVACEWSAIFESVIGEGDVVVLTDAAKKIHGLDLIMKRYGFAGGPQYHPQALAAVAVLRIAVTGISGKRKGG
ncbi:MAG: pyridoxamine 5'-phosphate oxidase family protein [Oscillospiraceae bacterium]|nr:pyridoxamine 5'-phosphate oxidase family protein [Oscillospiraceae bacterium]